MTRAVKAEEKLSVGVYRKQSLRASVIRTCKNCGAPGYWHNTPGVNKGCYAPEKVTVLGSNPVGHICPNCGALRDSVIEDHGEIWFRYFGSTLAVAWARFKNHLRRYLQWT